MNESINNRFFSFCFDLTHSSEIQKIVGILSTIKANYSQALIYEYDFNNLEEQIEIIRKWENKNSICGLYDASIGKVPGEVFLAYAAIFETLTLLSERNYKLFLNDEKLNNIIRLQTSIREAVNLYKNNTKLDGRVFSESELNCLTKFESDIYVKVLSYVHSTPDRKRPYSVYYQRLNNELLVLAIVLALCQNCESQKSSYDLSSFFEEVASKSINHLNAMVKKQEITENECKLCCDRVYEYIYLYECDYLDELLGQTFLLSESKKNIKHIAALYEESPMSPSTKCILYFIDCIFFETVTETAYTITDVAISPLYELRSFSNYESFLVDLITVILTTYHKDGYFRVFFATNNGTAAVPISTQSAKMPKEDEESSTTETIDNTQDLPRNRNQLVKEMETLLPDKECYLSGKIVEKFFKRARNISKTIDSCNVRPDIRRRVYLESIAFVFSNELCLHLLKSQIKNTIGNLSYSVDRERGEFFKSVSGMRNALKVNSDRENFTRQELAILLRRLNEYVYAILVEDDVDYLGTSYLSFDSLADAVAGCRQDPVGRTYLLFADYVYYTLLDRTDLTLGDLGPIYIDDLFDIAKISVPFGLITQAANSQTKEISREGSLTYYNTTNVFNNDVFVPSKAKTQQQEVGCLIFAILAVIALLTIAGIIITGGNL